MNELKRRTFLASGGVSLGSAALANFLARDAAAQTVAALPPGAIGLPHFPPRVKRVIFLCMAGGPSHLETFDEKPELARLHDQPMPESFTQGQPIAQLAGQRLKVQGPMTTFRRCGQSGQTISDFLPYHQKMADDLCILKSMVTEQINHDPAHTFFNTGTMPGGGKVPMLTLTSGFSEPRMPWPMVRAVTTDDELKAMYAYLHELPAVASPTR